LILADGIDARASGDPDGDARVVEHQPGLVVHESAGESKTGAV
jgi:hypothetical protein